MSDFDVEPVDELFLRELISEHEAQFGPSVISTLDNDGILGGKT